MKFYFILLSFFFVACNNKESEYFELKDQKEISSFSYVLDKNSRVIKETINSKYDNNVNFNTINTFLYDSKGRLKEKESKEVKDYYFYNENDSLILHYTLDKKDTRPLYVSIWGGANCLAQALWKLKMTRSPQQES